MSGKSHRGFFKKTKGPTGNAKRGGYQQPVQYEATSGEMNAGISERFKRMNFRGNGSGPSGSDQPNEMKPRNRLLEMFERETTEGQEGWRGLPDIPTPEEVMREDVELPTNNIDAPFESVDDYLSTHYDLLREDATAHLREGVSYLRADPHMQDNSEFCIYERVRIIGFTFASMGVCTRVSFSLARAGKRIPWASSKRLLPGTIVVLSSDEFETVKIATVAARPIAGLVQAGDPEVDLLFPARDNDLDTSRTYTMFESRSAYYEAYKHVLIGLQRMNEKNFPLARHLAMVDPDIGPPQYVLDNPEWDMSQVFDKVEDKAAVRRLNILEPWPETVGSEMDESQKEALSRILTKQVAIVQGPPGTGKTFTSVKALRAILSNMKEGDPPVVVACQTNHALDQLLGYVLEFEDNIIRLGGRTQDRDKIKKRTLYEMSKSSPIQIANSSFPRTKRSLENIKVDMKGILDAFKADFILPKHLVKRGLITDEQYQSFSIGNQDWVSAEEDASPEGDISSWLGRENIVPREQSFDKYLDYEDEDLEIERIQELEAEFLGLGEDEEFDDSLRGDYVSLSQRQDARDSIGVSQREIQEALKGDDVWAWPPHVRLAVYNHLRAKYLAMVMEEFRDRCEKYLNFSKDLAVAKREKQAYILESAKLIGMTTTGLAKYRTLVAATKPRVVMIEEAAESLEGPLIVGCTPSVQQLILVGDHRQLTGTCAVKDLERDPYFLCVSMFERLVNNDIGYTMLSAQRRMRPEIRQLIYPIYLDKLYDHESVVGRPSVKGMGDTNVFFYTHDQYEASNSGTSKVNEQESKMITEFCNYLVLNGNDPKRITILTFYAGQKFKIYGDLRDHQGLRDAQIRVATVDAYQGEENDIVILSLVRSNNEGKIGFLSVENRVCVALSRARLGFYIFGNAGLVTSASRLWWDVGQILSRDTPRIQDFIPVTCERHKNVVEIFNHYDWNGLTGGCRAECKERLPCGHECVLKCHPFDHSNYRCPADCGAMLPCGHRCSKQCFAPCACTEKCAEKRSLRPGLGYDEMPVNDIPQGVPYSSPDIRYQPQGVAYSSQDIRYQPTPVSSQSPAGVPIKAAGRGPSFARSANGMGLGLERKYTQVQTRPEKLIDFGDEEEEFQPRTVLPKGPPPPVPPAHTRPPIPPPHSRPNMGTAMGAATPQSPPQSWDRPAYVSPTFSSWELDTGRPNGISPPQVPSTGSWERQAAIEHWGDQVQYSTRGALPVGVKPQRYPVVNMPAANAGRSYGAVVTQPVTRMSEEAWPSLGPSSGGKQRQNGGGNVNWVTKASRRR
ncbi:hypothetical protein BJ508DRAFT_414451 [Ascobolus immersus RN42]|uniref:P-loop containing nucleoside triphosphate hydrolase protein n=1 Tax=Ascobolus immersus RN42 TaxID=1160509 RepID=A0A3N4IBE6_ASCIM|nr:hypothetical protein BJ508DRAFT_414451 [Ascobolus immersus RN42]